MEGDDTDDVLCACMENDCLFPHDSTSLSKLFNSDTDISSLNASYALVICSYLTRSNCRSALSKLHRKVLAYNLNIYFYLTLSESLRSGPIMTLIFKCGHENCAVTLARATKATKNSTTHKSPIGYRPVKTYTTPRRHISFLEIAGTYNVCI